MHLRRLHAGGRSDASRANSRQRLRPGRSMWQCRGFLVLLLSLQHMGKAFAGGAAPAAAGTASSNLHSTSTDSTPAAAAAQQGTAHHGRSLKQLGYDPYGIGYYDPYQAGVTPGFVNVDLNRETGLHVDVGTVAVDVSADKNYYGLGIGNLLGIGAAKDRGWNLQVGGGNIVDVSVTKDAGLGLWLLNGLANIQIGPDGRGWETGHIAAQSVPGSTAAAAAAAAAAPGQQVTQVVVDDPAAGTTAAAADSVAAEGEVHVASDTAAAAAAVEEPIITEEPINPQLTAAAAVAADGGQQSQPAQSAAARSSAARRSRPRTYVEPRPAVYVQPRPAKLTADDAATVWSGTGQYDTGAAAPMALDAAQPAAEAATAAAAAEAALPAIPQAVVTSVLAAPQPLQAAAAVGIVPAAVGTAAAGAAGAAASRRACEGGELVAVAGNKFKCKYRKGSRPAAVRTQPFGSAAQQ